MSAMFLLIVFFDEILSENGLHLRTNINYLSIKYLRTNINIQLQISSRDNK